MPQNNEVYSSSYVKHHLNPFCDTVFMMIVTVQDRGNVTTENAFSWDIKTTVLPRKEIKLCRGNAVL